MINNHTKFKLSAVLLSLPFSVHLSMAGSSFVPGKYQTSSQSSFYLPSIDALEDDPSQLIHEGQESSPKRFMFPILSQTFTKGAQYSALYYLPGEADFFPDFNRGLNRSITEDGSVTSSVHLAGFFQYGGLALAPYYVYQGTAEKRGANSDVYSTKTTGFIGSIGIPLDSSRLGISYNSGSSTTEELSYTGTNQDLNSSISSAHQHLTIGYSLDIYSASQAHVTGHFRDLSSFSEDNRIGLGGSGNLLEYSVSGLKQILRWTASYQRHESQGVYNKYHAGLSMHLGESILNDIFSLQASYHTDAWGIGATARMRFVHFGYSSNAFLDENITNPNRSRFFVAIDSAF